MQVKSNYMNYFYIILLIVIMMFLYNRYEDKIARNNNGNYDGIQNYLLSDSSSLANIKKPIIWIPIYNEYNSRNWIDRKSVV